MITRQRNKEHAFSLLEFLFSAFFAVFIGVSSVKFLHVAAEHGEQSLTQTRRTLQVQKVKALLDRCPEGMDSHRLPISCRVHKNNLSLFSGKLPPWSEKISSLKKKGQSALSMLTLAGTRPYRLEAVSTKGRYLEIIGCPLFEKAPDLHENNSYLLLTERGFFEAYGPSQSIYGEEGCRKFTLLAEEGMFSELPPLIEQESARVLFHIKQAHTIFVDKHNELRLIGHRGSTLIENQPLVPGVDHCEFSLHPKYPRGIFALTAKFQINGDTTEYTTHNHVSRTSPLQILLHLLQAG